jgi:hypothetical protein
MIEKPVNIIEAIKRRDIFGHFMRGKKFAAWAVFLKAIYNLEMTSDEDEIYKKCTGRARYSDEFQECYALVGRRGWKSSVSALIACWEALFSGQAEELTPGENGYIFLIATDRKQAQIVLSYVRAILKNFEDEIEKDLTWEIHLRNQVIISIKPATYRASRGFTTLAIVADELCFWRDETSANPAEEVISSILPGLKESGRLIGLSTPYSRTGYLFELYEENYKQESPILIWHASTVQMNPGFKQSIITRLMQRRGKEKTIAMRSEFEAEWRADIETFITIEEYQTAVLEGIPQVPAFASHQYRAFVDASGGKSDSFTLAISHEEDDYAALDLVYERRAPFNPEDAVSDIVEILKRYRIKAVTGDRYGGEWVASSFRKKGIVYQESKLDKSSIYEEFQALIAMRRLMLIDNARLQQQCCALERRLRAGGKDVIEHAPGAKDDLINSAAGACVLTFATEIATQITPSEMRARLPHMKESSTSRRQSRLAAARREMHEIMMADGCNKIVRKRPYF